MNLHRILMFSALGLAGAPTPAGATNTVTVTQSDAIGNEVLVEQRGSEMATATVSQITNAGFGANRAGNIAGGTPGILQTDSRNVSATISQQGDVDASLRQEQVRNGEAILGQTGFWMRNDLRQTQASEVVIGARQKGILNTLDTSQLRVHDSSMVSTQEGRDSHGRFEQIDSRHVSIETSQSIGFGDALILQQNLLDSRALLRQTDTVNQGSILQVAGQNLSATLIQDGVLQNAAISQSGSFLTASLTQNGRYGEAAITQTGSNNTASIFQSGRVVQYILRNMATIEQAGSGKTASLSQSGVQQSTGVVQR